MGFKLASPSNPTALTPVSKSVQVKHFQVARTETASALKAVLPGDATILSVVRSGSSVSNAATTATVTITAANNGGTISTKADDVKTSGATTGFVEMSALPNLEPVPLNGDITVNAVYAETGAASSSGGPWTYVINYVR